MAEEESEGKKRGRPAGEVLEKYTVLLPPKLGDWGKEQDGGLSALLRRLLRAEKARVEGGDDKR